MPFRLKRVVAQVGASILLSGVCCSMVNASVMASSVAGVSNLLISAANATVVFTAPADVSAATNAFNSDGESGSDGANGSGGLVQANVALSNATGQAQASTAATGAANILSAISLGGQGNFTGVTSPGSLASLSGLFNIDNGGVGGMVATTFSMDINAVLHGLTDGLGSFRTDADFELAIDGQTVLFDQVSLTGAANFTDTQVFSRTLTSDLLLDSSVTHFFAWTVHGDTEGGNSVPEPASMALVLFALVLLKRYSGRRAAPLTAA